MKGKQIIIISIAILVIVFIPFFLNWIIIGNDINSNISNSDLISFLGNYIGTIIGSLVSLIGIAITINFTSKQNKLDRELNIRPYCTIRYVGDVKQISTKVIAEIPIVFEPISNDGPKYNAILYIKNVGVGPAIEFEVSAEINDCYRKRFPSIMQRTPERDNNFTDVLQIGEEAAIPIYVNFNFDKITKEDITCDPDDEFGKYRVKPNILNKYKKFNILVTVKYRDVFQNLYCQKITLSSSSLIVFSSEGKADYSASLNLEEVTKPTKIK